uniref:NADH dehydrogenase subunit 2 n=1 Tax=Arocatus melanocephalus TaxID=1561047 RepID=UPI002008ED17|nr:NADH dehydrogenase subunit 2 [Arocatus melanocephalus]UPI55351.1 NADH dehydrogenase subunit 2 [Arocatus melanocephalus]
MFNYTKLLFLVMTILSTLIILSSNSWLGMWMGMEMNLISFIPFMSKIKNKKSSQSMIIYFMTQSMGSVIFLFSILMNKFIMISPIMMDQFIQEILITSMLLKLGAAPFHSWMPEMMSNMNWIEILILSTWQKVGPMIVLNSIMMNSWIIKVSVIMSTIIGAIGGIMFTSMRKILAYSSINHMSWMIMMMDLKSQWYSYLMIYSMLMTMTCIWFYKNNIFFMNQTMMNSTLMEKLTISMLMLSLGGMPPLLGFLPKWMVIQALMTKGMIMIMMIMIMMSMLTLFYYMRMISLFLLMFSTMNKWNFKNKNEMLMFLVLITNMMLPLFSIMSFL